MKKLLITGFEPFDGETVNPSWETVSLLPDTIGNYTLTKLRIPVVFGQAADMILAKAETLLPDVILCIGQAGGRAAITPEMVGINLRHAPIPDNTGSQPQDEPILVGGENALFATIPVRNIAKAIHATGIPSQVSYSAGAYVCNDVLYTLLHRFQGSETRVGFIHIPFCDQQNKTPSMSLSDLVKGLTIAIENL